MVEKTYDWENGAILGEHSRRKHKILGEYFFDYLTVRCQLPQREKFRLAIVDGFSGGGRYDCGTAGSPLIFLEELTRATETVNIKRALQGLGAIDIECLVVLNDIKAAAVEKLKTNVAPILEGIAQNVRRLHVRVEYLNEKFENAYPKIKELLSQGRYRNVIFNLDQCGHSHVHRSTLVDIMRSYQSAEIFYTFAISALLAFLRKSDPLQLAMQLAPFGLGNADLISLEGIMTDNARLGAAERIVFDAYKTCAPFVSPFSIHNPDGWRYWFIHFANVYRARQVYNNILHDNSTLQAHFGRSGLEMLSYNPDHDRGTLYLFDDAGRSSAKEQLLEDIPRLISEAGDVIGVGEFYQQAYNATPAHSDDIHTAMIENPDIEVITPSGGRRRTANTIDVDDLLKLKDQKSFFPMFLSAAAKPRGGIKG